MIQPFDIDRIKRWIDCQFVIFVAIYFYLSQVFLRAYRGAVLVR